MTKNEKSKPGFDAPWRGGFHITFENGYTVSVQYRAGTYCDHHDKILAVAEEINLKAAEGGTLPNMNNLYQGPSSTAEVAIWDEDGKWAPLPDWDDSVIGWQTPAEVLAILNEVAARD